MATVVHVMVKYHDLGWELKRLFSADNVRAGSQQAFADRLTEYGYPIGQQLISDYMRVKTEKVGGETIEKPRAVAPMEFIAAAIVCFDLTSKQAENLVTAWLQILPEKRHIAVLALVDTLRNTEHPTEAWREMLAFEEDLKGEVEEGTAHGTSLKDTAS